MRKLRNVLFVALVIFGNWACGKDVEGFDMTYRRQFSVDIGLNPFVSHNFKFNEIQSDTAAFFDLNKVAAAQVMRIEPRSMSLRALFPGNAPPFSFINRLEVLISDPSRTNLPEQVIFFRDDVPLNTGTQIDLVPNNVDVRPYLVDGRRFSVRISLQLRESPQRSVEMQWDASFFAIK